MRKTFLIRRNNRKRKLGLNEVSGTPILKLDKQDQWGRKPCRFDEKDRNSVANKKGLLEQLFEYVTLNRN